MNNNTHYFTEANQLLEKFISEPTQLYAGRLIKESIAELNKVNLNNIKDRSIYNQQRQQWLALHLKIVATLDEYYKPNSNPTFLLTVLPPIVDGVFYPYPVDPAEIKDPKIRAEYEQDIAENEKNRREADLQITLKRLLGKDPNLDPKYSYIEELKQDIPDYYTEYAEDKTQYNTTVETSSMTPERKAEFYKLLQ